MNPTTKKRSRLDLQERDLDIFETIYDLRFATLNHLTALFPSTNQKLINPNAEFKAGQKAIANRLSKLARQKLGYYYLKRIGYPLRLGTQPSVYTIDEKAGRVLAALRGYDLSDLLNQVKRNEKYFGTKSYKQFFLDHRLGINDFRVALIVALRQHQKADWLRDENQIPYWIEPTTKDDQKITVIPTREDIPTINNRLIAKPNHKLSRTPDATFLLKPDKTQDHTIAYIYEKDRGTERGRHPSNMATKLLCYFKWWQSKQHHQLFGTKHLKVLVETETERRLKNMIEQSALKINHGKGSKIFWFTTTDQISLDNPANILNPIWIIGQQDEYDPEKSIKDQPRHSLLEHTSKPWESPHSHARPQRIVA